MATAEWVVETGLSSFDEHGSTSSRSGSLPAIQAALSGYLAVMRESSRD